jgi:hypothetical protein
MPKLKCEHCGYEWTTRKKHPKKCSGCGLWLWKKNKNGMRVPDGTAKEKVVREDSSPLTTTHPESSLNPEVK